MKSSLRLLAAALALFASVSAFAQNNDAPASLAFVNADGSLTLPDGTVLPALPGPMFNEDGTLTLPDGTVVQPPALHTPPVKNADGSLMRPDGHVVDLSKTPPLGDRGRGRGHRGPPPSGG